MKNTRPVDIALDIVQYRQYSTCKTQWLPPADEVVCKGKETAKKEKNLTERP